MSNFALVPQGSLIVYDVIVATQQFIDNAPASWKDQWEYIVNVDGVQCGPDWAYDPGSGSFYPPAPPAPPPEQIVSYDQLLESQGYSPDIVGARFVTGTDPANLDISWAEDRLFPGMKLQVADFADGDFIDVVAVNPVDQSIVGQWATNIPVPPNGTVKTLLSAAATIPAGVIIRMIYHGTVGAKVYAQYRTWRKP